MFSRHTMLPSTVLIPCIDNAKHRLMYKLMYISCLLTVTHQYEVASLPSLEGNPYIIVGKKNGQHMVNLRKPWMRIVKSAGVEHVRLHDLRHSFASFAVSSGASLNLIGEQLGHRSLATTQRYAHLARDPVRQATETTANIIAEAMRANG